MIRRFGSTLALTAGAVLLALGLGTSALAQVPDGPHRGRGLGPRGAGLPLHALDLTDTQREQVRDVMQRHREDMAEAGKRLRGAYDAQRDAVQSVPVNDGLIRSTSQTLAAAQTDMALLQARVHSEVWTLLTPEQQAKAKELKAERGTRMKRRAERQPRD